MSLVDAVLATGPIPANDAPQAQKKRYSELLSLDVQVFFT
jgi:hypothetical protein